MTVVSVIRVDGCRNDNILTCVFSVLTYCVRLFGKIYRGGGGDGGGENYNREPNSPSSTFRWMT